MDLINKSDKNNSNIKELIAIEYPARVENIDKVIDTLGGKEDLSKSFSEHERLQLQFRNNFCAKPVLSSEPLETSGMLIKVKMRKSKKNPQEKAQFSSELLGTIGQIYKFDNMLDFQYLPIQANEKTGKSECIYSEIVPNDITVGPSWFKENKTMPPFLPPMAFTRTDSVQLHLLKNETVKEGEEERDDANFSITNRSTRSSYGISVPFDKDIPIPTKADERAKDVVKEGLVSSEVFNSVKKLFTDRPVWTLASIRAHVRSPPKRYLSNILALMSYSFSTGPWRNCLVRFGYDPRKTSESRYYQLCDFRVRAVAGLKTDVKSRRTTASNQKRLKVTAKADRGEDKDMDADFKTRKSFAIFTSDTIPPFKACHYMLIDIQVPKIQEMLKNPPQSSSGAFCDEKRGWLPVGFLEQCRDIMSSITRVNMLKYGQDKNISFDLKSEDNETRSEIPEEDDSSDNENFDDDMMEVE